MFELECASLLTRRMNLTHESLGESDRTAVADALQAMKACHRCPATARSGVPAAVNKAITTGRKRRRDPLLGVWAVAREQIAANRNEEQELWLAQHSRCVLPREAIKALLGIYRPNALDLIGRPPVVEELRRQQDTGLCDNHLHSGAADELGELLNRLVPRVASEDEPRKLCDAVGNLRTSGDLNMGPPLLGLTAACLLLDDVEDPNETTAKRLAGEIWWRHISMAALQARQIDASDFRQLRDPVQKLAVVQGKAPQLETLYATLGEVALGEGVSAARQQAAKRGLISLAVLYGLVSIPHSSSLGTFVPRFRVMRALRGLFGDDPGRLTSAVSSMYVHDNVTAVELRKSIVPTSRRTVSVPCVRDAIKLDIEDHAWSAIAACNKAERPDLVMRMPLTFTRRDVKPVDLAAEADDYAAFRDPVGETLAVADGIVQATAASPEERFVGAVDVVGDEKLVPNWLYALAFQRIAGADGCELEFACHAGEYFADRLEGLRRIGEVALFRPAAVRRIGHCLALGTDKGVASHAVDDVAGVLLENAIWALLVLENRGASGLGVTTRKKDAPTALLGKLKRTIQQIAHYVFGFDAGIGAVRRWYLDRFDTATMARWLPDLLDSAHDSTMWPRGARRHMLPQPAGPLDGMLAATVYDMPVEVGTDGGVKRIRYDRMTPLPEKLLKDTHDLLATVEDAAFETLLQWLKTEAIVIESCPSSNAALVDLPITEHPIWRFHEDELRCSVNTDDPALFGASLGEEYAHAGMVADNENGDGPQFVAELAETSRTVGTIERNLCHPGEDPIDVYHALLRVREAPSGPE